MDDSAVADQINAATDDEYARMADPLSPEVELLRGLHVKETDEWHTTATVRELNGEDEEALATLGAKTSVSYAEYMTGVLERAVISIGSLPATGQLLNKLILPDRDMLFLGIIKATYGIEREVITVCNSCQEQQHITIELEEDFPVVKPEYDLRAPLSIELSKGTAQFSYPNGFVTEYANKNAKNTAHLDTLVIAQCVITQDENTSIEEKIEWARALSVPDRKKVEKALTNSVSGIGPQLGEVNARCANCNAELPLLMDWVSLLLG